MPDVLDFEDGDERKWLCRCGNRPLVYGGGFVSYKWRDWATDAEKRQEAKKRNRGRLRESWDGRTYVCVVCGRLIDSTNRAVIGTHRPSTVKPKPEREPEQPEQEKPRGLFARFFGARR